jgi:hypothetical protein
MNRLALAIVMLAIMVRPVSAQTSYTVAPDFRIPRIVGGEVDANGGRVLGHGFSSSSLGDGVYEIVLNQDLFRGGCPVLNAMPMGELRYPPTPEVYQPSTCSRTFYVYWFSANANGFVTTPFQFVAVGTSGR